MVEPCHGRVVMLLIKVDVFSHITHGINHTLSLVKLHSLLAIVGKFHRLANLKITAVGLDDIEQQLDERGLSHTVVANDA